MDDLDRHRRGAGEEPVGGPRRFRDLGRGSESGAGPEDEVVGLRVEAEAPRLGLLEGGDDAGVPLAGEASLDGVLCTQLLVHRPSRCGADLRRVRGRTGGGGGEAEGRHSLGEPRADSAERGRGPPRDEPADRGPDHREGATGRWTTPTARGNNLVGGGEEKDSARLGSAVTPPPLQELLLYFQQSPAAENSYGLELLLRFHIVCILYLSSLLLTRVQYILQYMYNILYTTYRIPDTTVVASVYRFLFQRTGFSPQNSSLI